MMGLKPNRIFLSTLTFIALAFFLSINSVRAQEPTNQELLDRIETLEQELQYFRESLATNTARSEQAEERAEAAEIKAEAAARTAENAVNTASAVAPLPDTKWHLAGYADAGAMFRTNGGDDTFAFGHFNPVFLFQYKDIVMFEGELEFEIDEDGNTEVALEYAQLDFFLHDNITLVVGKFLSPIGQFKERLHPTWINKIGYAPAGFGHDGVQPGGDVGIMVRGGVPVGKRSMFTYSLMVGNGPRMGHEGNISFEGFGKDDNQNKAFGGRIGFLPVPYLELGFSFLKGKIDGLHGEEEGDAHPESISLDSFEFEPSTATVKLWGADAAYTRGPWDFRFEYLKSVRDPIYSFDEEEGEVALLPEMTLTAWYVQLAYRLSEIGNSSFLHKFEPVVRYGKFNISGNHHLEEANAQTRLNIGLNYWIAPSLVARIGYERRKFLEEGLVEKIILLQAAYGF
ncbi:MAG: hypothetical protein IID52_01320 [Proteobacteria bacterium]|nr:hypothetical protein [Pseudomonadota bacterium]